MITLPPAVSFKIGKRCRYCTKVREIVEMMKEINKSKSRKEKILLASDLFKKNNKLPIYSYPKRISNVFGIHNKYRTLIFVMNEISWLLRATHVPSEKHLE